MHSPDHLYIDLGKLESVQCRGHAEEERRMGVPISRLFLQHRATLRHFYPRQLGFPHSFRPFLTRLVKCVPWFFHIHFWCFTPSNLRSLRFLPSHCHALVVEVSRCTDSLTAGSRCRRTLLRFLGYFPTDHLYSDRCYIQ